MSPADAPLIFERGVLGFMDEGVAAFKKIDDALMGFDQRMVFAHGIGVAMVAEEHFIICGIAIGLA